MAAKATNISVSEVVKNATVRIHVKEGTPQKLRYHIGLALVKLGLRVIGFIKIEMED